MSWSFAVAYVDQPWKILFTMIRRWTSSYAKTTDWIHRLERASVTLVCSIAIFSYLSRSIYSFTRLEFVKMLFVIFFTEIQHCAAGWQYSTVLTSCNMSLNREIYDCDSWFQGKKSDRSICFFIHHTNSHTSMAPTVSILLQDYKLYPPKISPSWQ